jgi:hypothetical protein
LRPDTSEDGLAIDYLIKEVSFSTCDNKFFGELEKEMLIPSNISIYGKIVNAKNLHDYRVRLDFPSDAGIGYIKQPLSSTVENNRRVLTYRLEELVNFDDYWWLPLEGETQFSIRLNLLPPFPSVRPLGMQISCSPDVAVGLETDVTTKIRLEAEEDIDQIMLKLTAPMRSMPGVFIAITGYSDDTLTEPRQSVVSPQKRFPFPRLSIKKGQAREYEVKTRIVGDPSNMVFLKCEQDILTAKLISLSESTQSGPPCGVAVENDAGDAIPIQRIVRSTILQATAQVMYSPYSVRRETKAPQKIAIPASA